MENRILNSQDSVFSAPAHLSKKTVKGRGADENPPNRFERPSGNIHKYES